MAYGGFVPAVGTEVPAVATTGAAPAGAAPGAPALTADFMAQIARLIEYADLHWAKTMTALWSKPNPCWPPCVNLQRMWWR